MEYFEQWASYLTDGEIFCEIKGGRYDCGVKLPDGIIFGQDNAGNYYLNGKPAWITYRKVGEMA